MTKDIQVNIDTVDFTVEGMHFHIPGTTTAQLSNDDGEVLNRFQNRKAIDGKYGVHPIHVRTFHDGKQLHVQGSPYGFLFGQNIYTASDLQQACMATIKRICEEFDFRPDLELASRWKNGEVNFQRVDLAVNFRLTSEQEVKKVLRQIGLQLIEMGYSIKTIGKSVYWMPRNGKTFVMAFYAKGEQMRRSTSIKKLSGYEKLVEDAATILRVELRLRESVLRDLGLQKLSAWKPDTASTVFKQYMRKLKFMHITSGRLQAAELNELPNKLRPVLALHKAGEDLQRIYPSRTWQRHLSEFRARGIDLRCPNQAEGSVVELLRILSPKNVIMKPPRWLICQGYCPSVGNPVSVPRKPSNLNNTYKAIKGAR